MEIKFYNTKDSNNTINKTLENETILDFVFKDVSEVQNPVVMIHSESYINFNYAFITEFSRFYFVEKVEVFPKQMYKVYLKCDVLESFKEEILKSTGFINQQTKNINPYYMSNYEAEVKKEVDVYKGNVSLTDERTNILVTVGLL